MEYKIVPITPMQVPIRLVKLPLNFNEKCRKAEASDYVAYTILHTR